LQQNIGLCQKIYDCEKEISELYIATNTDSVILINQLAGFNLRPKRSIGFFHYFKGENGYSLQGSCAMVELQVLSDRSHNIFCLIKPSIRAFIERSSALAGQPFFFHPTQPKPTTEVRNYNHCKQSTCFLNE